MGQSVRHNGKIFQFPLETTNEEILNFLRDSEMDIPAIKKNLKEVNKEYKLPIDLLGNIAQAESSFRPEVISGRKTSSKGAIGLMQFMPSTAKEMGIDPTKPDEAIRGAGKYLNRLMKRFDGDEVLAVAAYNWGPTNVAKKGIEKAPKETRDYIEKVLGINFEEYLFKSKNPQKLEPGVYQDEEGKMFQVDKFNNLKNFDG